MLYISLLKRSIKVPFLVEIYVEDFYVRTICEYGEKLTHSCVMMSLKQVQFDRYIESNNE